MPELMTFEEAREFLRTTTSTLYRLIQNGTVPASKVGGQWRFKRDRLEEWLSAQEVNFRDNNSKKRAGRVKVGA